MTSMKMMRTSFLLAASLVVSVASHGVHHHHHHQQHDKSEQEQLRHLRSPSKSHDAHDEFSSIGLHTAWTGGNDDKNPFRRQRQLDTSPRPLELCGAPSLTIEEKLQSAKIVQEWEEAHSGENRARKLASFSATIPVYVHVIQRDAVYGALPDIYRDNMIAALNDGFTGTGFSFVLMETDVFINATYFDCAITRDIDGNLPIKQLLRKGGADAMNIYVCNTEATVVGGGITTGWANTAPQVMSNLVSDGMFITNPVHSAFTDINVFYSTAQHESGHLLGLLHTFDGGCSTDLMNHYQYSITGDGVIDTASHSGPTQNQPGYQQCWLTDPPLDTCDDSIEGIDPGLDPVKNYMNYIDSSCMAKHGEFTTGQVSRMIAHWEAFRDPNRGITCGCHYVCTEEVLDTVISGAATCRSKITQYLATVNELNACYRAAMYFPTQCGLCHPLNEPCNVFVPAPTPVTFAPVTFSPITSAPVAEPPTVSPVTASPVMLTAMPVTDAPVASPPTTALVTMTPVSAPPVTVSPVTSAPVASPLTTAPGTIAPVAKPTSAPVSGAPVSDPTSDAPATASPVTSHPTTASPVTVAPVTSPPTSDAPVTASPVTSHPTTASPVTGAPVTMSPTSDAPVTASPVTSHPTTASPVTGAPVTMSPTSDAPVTASPVTSHPTTASPVTMSPTSGSPVTASPVTSHPTTASPVTGAPVTSSPTSGSPVTASPVTSHPTTASPITSAAVTSPPTTGSPVTASPVTSRPTTASPVTSRPTTASPVTEAPVTSTPSAPSPVTSAPISSRPTARAPLSPPPTIAPSRRATSLPSADNGSIKVPTGGQTIGPTFAPTFLPTRTPPISFRACAKAARGLCGCVGTPRCKKEAVRQTCLPPRTRVERSAYFRRVLKILTRVCSRRKTMGQ